MKFNPANPQSHPTLLALAYSVMVNGVDIPVHEHATSHGGTATGTIAGTEKVASGKVTERTVAEVASHPALLELVNKYDEVKDQARSYMCDMAEAIAKNNIGRPQVIKTLMEARGVTLESAQSDASRLIKLSADADAIEGLRNGSLTIRETVYGKKPKSATPVAKTGDGSSANPASPKKTDAGKKEDRYNATLQAFVTEAKASGFSRSDIIVGVTAALKDAEVK